MSSCNTEQDTNLFIISFTAGAESGLALIAAPTERSAIQVLRNSGKYNCSPEQYVIQQARNLGMTHRCSFGLLMESYVNALTAYEAISSVADKLVGMPGDPGKSAYQIAVENGFSGSEEEWLDSLGGGFWEEGVGEKSLQQAGMSIPFDLVEGNDVTKFNYTEGTVVNYDFSFKIYQPEEPKSWFAFLICMVYGIGAFKLNDEYVLIDVGEEDLEFDEDNKYVIIHCKDIILPDGTGRTYPSTGTIELINGALGNASVSIMGGAAQGNYSIAIGGTAGYEASAVGTGSAAFGEDSAAFGAVARANADRSVAVGNHARADNEQEIALGAGQSHSQLIGDEYQDSMFHVGHSGTNLLESHNNGEFFVKGVGGYDGTNPYESDSLQDVLENKQATLVSGTNLKTINNESLLGSGNITIQSGDPNAVSFTPQTLTNSQKTQARTNIGAISVFSIPINIDNSTVDSSVTYADILAAYNSGDVLLFTDTESGASAVVSVFGEEEGIIAKASLVVPNDKTIFVQLLTLTATENDIQLAVENSVFRDGTIPVVDVTSGYPAMSPNKLYRYTNTVTGLVTFSFASPEDNTILNEYMFVFDTGNTPPVITWPNQIKVWEGNNYPAINANKTYEVHVVDGRGVVGEFPKYVQ